MIEHEQPIRIAQIMGKWVGGGVESVVMNYYRNIDRNKVQFDFLFDEDSNGIPFDEIKNLGGKVILIPPYQKIYKYYKSLKKILKDGNYKIVHSHINVLSVFSLYAAKRAGVPVRIAHSHSTTNKKEKKKNLIKQILKPFSKTFSTDCMCCSEHAGRWLFGDKEYDNGNVYILNNAIDLNKFKYDKNIKEMKRNELGIDSNTIVLGHVGRFVEQKNHRFLIELFNEFHKQIPNSELLLVGQGPLVEEIKEKVKKLQLEKNVRFLGQQDDISSLYQAFDIFVFPSLYEGVGMALVEAQVSGCYCVCSAQIPIIAKVCNNCEFIDLNSNINIWIEKLVEFSKKSEQNYFMNEILKKYDIKLEAKKLENKYLSMYMEEKKYENIGSCS